MEKFHILKSLTILYAEDDLIIRESTTRILSMFFKKVFVATNGDEALIIFHNNKIDVLLIDYLMPKLNGYQTIKRIREFNNKIPAIIVSAYTDKEKLLNAIELNLIKYLEKPILYDNLIEVFGSIISYLEKNDLILIRLVEDYYYSFASKKIISKNTEISLTKNEITFIELLLEKPNQLISKELIEHTVFNEPVLENTLRNMVYRLRKKINFEIITTIKDLGYLIKKSSD